MPAPYDEESMARLMSEVAPKLMDTATVLGA
jgi:hypothetical protein